MELNRRAGGTRKQREIGILLKWDLDIHIEGMRQRRRVGRKDAEPRSLVKMSKTWGGGGQGQGGGRGHSVRVPEPAQSRVECP